MAGDWIKMRSDLYRHPKVVVMADILMDEDGDLAKFVNQNCQRDMAVTRNVTRNACVGALLSVWGVMRHQGVRIGDDLKCRNVTVSVLDDIADMPGFGDAMRFVEWVIEDEDSIVFPGFFREYNVEPERKEKTKNAERQARYREKRKLVSNGESNVTSNVTGDVTVTPREEKRREENKENLTKERSEETKPGEDLLVQIPPEMDTEEFRQMWKRWLDYCFCRDGYHNEIQLQQQMMALFGTTTTSGIAKAIADLRVSIESGTKGRIYDSSADFSKRPTAQAPPKPDPYAGFVHIKRKRSVAS
jgi:hypothetical protein